MKSNLVSLMDLMKKKFSKIFMVIISGIMMSFFGLQQVQAAEPALYASVGEELMRFAVNISDGTLIKKGSVRLQSFVQYAIADTANKNLYVATSDMTPPSQLGRHCLYVFSINQSTGELTLKGFPVNLPERPINITIDRSQKHVLVAYNGTSTAEVYNIQSDGTIGELVQQDVRPDGSSYTHQVMVSPFNDTVLLPGLGVNGPSSLTVFSYKNGLLTKTARIMAPEGLAFRHSDFHPTKPFVYLVVEIGNKLDTFTLKNGVLSEKPLFITDTIPDPANVKKGQHAGAIHVHPNGKFLYVSNRAPQTEKVGDKNVFSGGENTIAVFSINQETGEPKLIQTVDTHGFEPRTFAIDPTNKMLVVANQFQLLVKDGSDFKTVPASLSTYKMGTDGKLTYIKTYNIETKVDRTLMWTDFVGLK